MREVEPDMKSKVEQPSIAVVIPFYQKASGILTKAIVSALGQGDSENVTIIVVDDTSPVPARVELADLIARHPGRIVIIEQPNAGPAAARNRGLDSVPTGTEYVAFLDSDDEWIPTHLGNALTALEHGCDFYFSDFYHLNQTVSAFNRAKRIQVAEHAQIGDSKELHYYSGNMFDQILRGNIIGTSTVVYRFRAFPKLRFRKEFVYAGEDYIFWLELATFTKKIAFSSTCECHYGPGVNVFSGSGWGTEKSLNRLHDEMKYKKALPKIFQLDTIQTQENRETVRTLRRSFVQDLMHRIVHRRPIDPAILKHQFTVDPQSFFYFLPLALGIVLKR